MVSAYGVYSEGVQNSMKPGDKVKFKNAPIPSDYLNGETGVIESAFEMGWVVKLDNDVPGHYTGKSWGYESELEVIEDAAKADQES
jgi:hypothetical protein